MSSIRASPVKIAAAGVLGGLLSGVFGVGGGIVMVPLFVLWLGLSQKRAISTSLLAIIPIAVGGIIGYAADGALDWVVGLTLAAGSVFGGQVGVRLLPRVPVTYLQVTFAALLVYSAYQLVWPAQWSTSGGGQPWILLMLVGILAGLAASLLGVGGGVILVPAMVLLTSLNIDQARGTSLVVVLLTAATATFSNVRAGRTDTRTGWIAGLCGAPAGLIGAQVGQWLPHEQASVLFAVLMLVAAAQMLRKALTDPATVDL